MKRRPTEKPPPGSHPPRPPLIWPPRSTPPARNALEPDPLLRTQAPPESTHQAAEPSDRPIAPAQPATYHRGTFRAANRHEQTHARAPPLTCPTPTRNLRHPTDQRRPGPPSTPKRNLQHPDKKEEQRISTPLHRSVRRPTQPKDVREPHKPSRRRESVRPTSESRVDSSAKPAMRAIAHSAGSTPSPNLTHPQEVEGRYSPPVTPDSQYCRAVLTKLESRASRRYTRRLSPARRRRIAWQWF